MFPIGSECAKKLPKEFIFTFEQNKDGSLKPKEIKANGGALANQQCDKGCLTQGDFHSQGGEAFKIKDDGRQVEIEKDEPIVIGDAMDDPTVRTITGTNLEIINQINKLGGGRDILKDKNKPVKKAKGNIPIPKLDSTQVVINRRAAGDPAVHTYTGTNREILNKINTSTGGKPI
jgi:hypothetical protein